MEHKTRPLPKNTIIWIFVLIGIAVISVIYNSFMQSSKIENILKTNGFEHISNVSVYANHDVKHDQSKKKGLQYTISFDNDQTKQHCKGFIIIMNHTNKLITDLDCK